MQGGYTPCFDVGGGDDVSGGGSARRRHCAPSTADVMCDSTLNLSRCAPWLCITGGGSGGGGASRGSRRRRANGGGKRLTSSTVQLLSCRRGLSASTLNLQSESLLTTTENDDDDDCDENGDDDRDDVDDDDDGDDGCDDDAASSDDYDVILSDSDVRLSDFDLAAERRSDVTSVASDVDVSRDGSATDANLIVSSPCADATVHSVQTVERARVDFDQSQLTAQTSEESENKHATSGMISALATSSADDANLSVGDDNSDIDSAVIDANDAAPLLPTTTPTTINSSSNSSSKHGVLPTSADNQPPPPTPPSSHISRGVGVDNLAVVGLDDDVVVTVTAEAMAAADDGVKYNSGTTTATTSVATVSQTSSTEQRHQSAATSSGDGIDSDDVTAVDPLTNNSCWLMTSCDTPLESTDFDSFTLSDLEVRPTSDIYSDLDTTSLTPPPSSSSSGRASSDCDDVTPRGKPTESETDTSDGGSKVNAYNLNDSSDVTTRDVSISSSADEDDVMNLSMEEYLQRELGTSLGRSSLVCRLV